MEKSREDLEHELLIRDALEKEREINEEKYAIKLIERIVFALIATVALGVLGALIRLVLIQ